MGTHPIFESVFDCLTEGLRNNEKHAEKKNENQKSWSARDWRRDSGDCYVCGIGYSGGTVVLGVVGIRVCVCGCAVNRGFKLLVTTSNGGVCNSVGRVR